MGSDDLTYYAYVETAENGKQYVRFPKTEDKLDASFTGPFAKAWKGSAEAVRWMAEAEAAGVSVPSLYLSKTGKVYFMHGSTYVRATMATHTIDEGFPKSIAAYWGEMKPGGFDTAMNSALWWDENRVYFFKGDQYVRYDLAADKVDPGFPKTIGSYWNGFKEAGFGSGVDAFVRWDKDWAYAFKNDKYVRFHIPTDKVDQSPRGTVDHWNALAQAGVLRVLSMWAAPAVEAPATAGTRAPSKATGFPTGKFKIRNEATGQCAQAFTEKEGKLAYDREGYRIPNKNEGRDVRYVALRPCSDTADQVWRYNPKTQQLENQGVGGKNCALMSIGVSSADMLEGDSFIGGGDEEAPQREQGPAFQVSHHWRDTDPSVTSAKLSKFRTEDGYIVLSDVDTSATSKQTYWTAYERDTIAGDAKGKPGQKWTFPTVS